MYLNDINELSIMLVNEIESFTISDYNKLLILTLAEKYDTYIKQIINTNSTIDGKYYLDLIQNLYISVMNITNTQFIETICEKINNLILDIPSDITIFKSYLDEISSFDN